MTRRTAAALVACAAWALATSGCAPAPNRLEPTTESLVRNVFQPTCGTSGCHSQPEPQQGLDLSSADGILRTAIGQPPSIGTAATRYPSLIVPGDPDASFLVAKITLPGADEGVPMPPTDYMLTDEAVTTIRDWIRAMPASP
jgi:hypothetical protein